MSTEKKRKPESDSTEQAQDASNKKARHSEAKGFFSGNILFVCDSAMGKTRAELFRKQLDKNGAQVTLKLDSSVDFVVVDDLLTCERVCEILHVDIECIKTYSFKAVTTTWLSACLKEKRLVPTDRYILDLASFLRDKATREKSPEKEDVKVNESSAKDEKLFPKSGVMWRAIPKKKRQNNDDAGDSGGDSNYDGSDGNVSDSGSENEAKASTSQKRVPQNKWICAQSSANKSGNVNEHITKKLQELATIYENTKDTWRALGYQKAIAALRRHPKPITSFEEAKALRGVGSRLAEKIWEIVESGELRKLDELSSNEDLKTLDMFTKLWGAGPTTASAWVRAGFKSLDDLRTKANLTRQQKIGLQYYDELLDRMPRSEAAKIEAVVKDVAAKVDPGLICMACGSYRRGRATCGDVDVLITHPDGKSHRGVFSKILNSLRESGFLTDDLVTQEDSGNQKKYLGVCKLPGEDKKHRRLDIIVVPNDEYACAIMYFTGSAHFNRSMRHLAGKMNMSLSEHSLNKGVVKVNGVKVNKGTPLPTPTEESVFEHLGLKYRPPEERDHK